MAAAWGPLAPACRGARGAGIVRLALGARGAFTRRFGGGAGQCGRGPASCAAGGTCAMPGVAGACTRRRTLGIAGAGVARVPVTLRDAGPTACGALRCDRVGGGVVRGRAARG